MSDGEDGECRVGSYRTEGMCGRKHLGEQATEYRQYNFQAFRLYITKMENEVLCLQFPFGLILAMEETQGRQTGKCGNRRGTEMASNWVLQRHGGRCLAKHCLPCASSHGYTASPTGEAISRKPNARDEVREDSRESATHLEEPFGPWMVARVTVPLVGRTGDV